MADAISLRAVTKRFGDNTVLDLPTLDIAENTVTALIGPNGAGKTTFMKIVAGLWMPSGADALRVMGRDLAKSMARSGSGHDVGFVGDASQLYGTLTVRENLEYMARLYGVRSGDREARVVRSLEACGLADRANDRVWTLSTGLKQRANIARALVTRPRLLLLDEPTSGLDPISVQRVYEVLLDLRERGISILFCTHMMQEVDDLCDRVLFLSEGRIIADGTPTELKEHVGVVVYTIPLLDGQLGDLRQQLLARGVTRVAMKRDGGALTLSVFGCEQPAWLDEMGLDYSRRRADLSDAFLALAGE